MASRNLDLIVNTQNSTLLSSFNSAAQSPSLLNFVFGDTTPLSVRLVEPSGNSTRPWRDVDLTDQLVRVAIGNLGAVPSGGTFTLSYGGDTTSALSYASTAAQVSTALNLLASITSAGGVTVTSTASGIFRIVFVTAAVTTAITGNSASLYPTSTAYIAEAQTGSATEQAVFVVRLEVQPAAYVELADNLASPAVTIAVVREGAAGVSEIQTISLDPLPYDGVFKLTYDSEETTDLAWDSTAAEIQTALRALASGDLTTVTVTGDFPLFTVTFRSAAGDVGLISGDGSALIVPTGRKGTISLNTTGVVELLAASASANVSIEVEIVDANTGASWTALQTAAVLREDIIPNTPASQTSGPVYLLESVANLRFVRFDAAQTPSDAYKAQAAANLGFPTYTTLALANAGEGEIGIPFFDTTLFKYRTTTDIA